MTEFSAETPATMGSVGMTSCSMHSMPGRRWRGGRRVLRNEEKAPSYCVLREKGTGSGSSYTSCSSAYHVESASCQHPRRPWRLRCTPEEGMEDGTLAGLLSSFERVSGASLCPQSIADLSGTAPDPTHVDCHRLLDPHQRRTPRRRHSLVDWPLEKPRVASPPLRLLHIASLSPDATTQLNALSTPPQAHTPNGTPIPPCSRSTRVHNSPLAARGLSSAPRSCVAPSSRTSSRTAPRRVSSTWGSQRTYVHVDSP